MADLIEQKFGERLSLPTIGRILRKLGMSPQRPLYRAYQQDPEKVRIWKQETYPAIREQAARRQIPALLPSSVLSRAQPRRVGLENVKHDQIKRAVPMSKGHLWTLTQQALLRLQKIPEIVRGFFGDPHLAYIKAQSQD